MRGLGAIDLVGHQQLREDRPMDEAEGAALIDRFLQHLGAENIGRHQIRRELHAPRIEAEHDAERFDELGLGEARHADEQAMAAGQQSDERFLDDLPLAEDDGADRRARRGDAVERDFGRPQDRSLQSGRIGFGHQRLASSWSGGSTSQT